MSLISNVQVHLEIDIDHKMPSISLLIIDLQCIYFSDFMHVCSFYISRFSIVQCMPVKMIFLFWMQQIDQYNSLNA